MKYILLILLGIIDLETSAQLFDHKGLVFTCVVSQTSTSCDVYTFDFYRDNMLAVKFGDKEWNSELYSVIRSEKEIQLNKDDVKKLKRLISEVKRMNSLDSTCREHGGWQVDLFLEDKRWNFCTVSKTHLLWVMYIRILKDCRRLNWISTGEGVRIEMPLFDVKKRGSIGPLFK